ncbi:DUF983 domain-containing protein [Sphingobium estronivorans]|uniref:DUF983 domain-containing protein n=1 Tax=Sphingobium estronivorans TaxID=1577690 RepID=UPI0013C2B83D|nr:DUF983 domain-containing protein [Sphingobium estronivorans]
MQEVSPILAGLAGRCPACGKGKLYHGYLHLVETCDNCSARLSHADAEDAPVTFMLILVGGVGMLGIVISIVGYNLPAWLVLAIWAPLILILSVAVLPPCKGVLVGLQYKYKAGEHSTHGRLDPKAADHHEQQTPRAPDASSH